MLADLARSYTGLGRAILRFPQAPWEDALSHGQMQSKAWAIDHLGRLNRNLGLIYVLGGWLGTLSMLLFQSPLQFTKVRSFDIDPTCEPIADQLNIEYIMAGWRFKAVTMDMFRINYGPNHHYKIPQPGRIAQMTESCATVINTCCDHVSDFPGWWALIPIGKLVLLQNNNFKQGGSDHVNTVGSLNDLIDHAPMTTVLVKDQLKFEKYTRFMVIGIK